MPASSRPPEPITNHQKQHYAKIQELEDVVLELKQDKEK